MLRFLLATTCPALKQRTGCIPPSQSAFASSRRHVTRCLGTHLVGSQHEVGMGLCSVQAAAQSTSQSANLDGVPKRRACAVHGHEPKLRAGPAVSALYCAECRQ